MGSAIRCPRRTFVFTASLTALSGCKALPFISTDKTASTDPRQTLDTYFSLLSASKYGEAEQLMSSAFVARLGRGGVDSLLHSIQSARVTDVVDAVAWANQLGAHLPNPPSDRREYLVTLDIATSPNGAPTWTDGTNRRFIDLLRTGATWKIDAIATTPGVLITGNVPATRQDQRQQTTVLPIEPLKIGEVPVDRAIYAARQNAVKGGGVPWATDPVQVVHHDGPSFGLQPNDPVQLLREDVDPVSLVHRAFVVVRQNNHAYLVTLVQPIKTGDGGVWAIAAVEEYVARTC